MLGWLVAQDLLVQALELAKVPFIASPAPARVALDLLHKGGCGPHHRKVLLLELDGLLHDVVQPALGLCLCLCLGSCQCHSPLLGQSAGRTTQALLNMHKHAPMLKLKTNTPPSVKMCNHPYAHTDPGCPPCQHQWPHDLRQQEAREREAGESPVDM